MNSKYVAGVLVTIAVIALFLFLSPAWTKFDVLEGSTLVGELVVNGDTNEVAYFNGLVRTQ